jgi:hypothetical protein
MRADVVSIVLASSLTGCAIHAATPALPPDDAAGGHAPPGFDAPHACGSWRAAVGPDGDAALRHVSFPELDPQTSCFVPVSYASGAPEAGPIPVGCGYPRGPETQATLRREAARYRAIAAGTATDPLPLELRCALPDDVRQASAASNARTLERLATRLDHSQRYPYAAASTFGFGWAPQGEGPLIDWRPGQPCPAISQRDMDHFGINIARAHRAAEAYLQGIAPVITFSGGAVHSRLTEAFMLTMIATCKLGVRADAILVDPCADHTHTNLRNTGSLLVALGARTGYVVTDDGLQSAYLQEWTFFDLLGGSLDQRALRDFGASLGSFRQASEGMEAGFWFTPYRFWAEPEAGLGGLTCAAR